MHRRDLEHFGYRPSLRGFLWGLVALAVLGPALLQLVAALIPYLVLIAAIAGVLRLIWFYTSRW